ncbi:hypothetical protein AB1N83_001914 [Pleurotus pulmonarius]
MSLASLALQLQPETDGTCSFCLSQELGIIPNSPPWSHDVLSLNSSYSFKGIKDHKRPKFFNKSSKRRIINYALKKVDFLDWLRLVIAVSALETLVLACVSRSSTSDGTCSRLIPRLQVPLTTNDVEGPSMRRFLGANIAERSTFKQGGRCKPRFL